MLQRAALRKLLILDAAEKLGDLDVPPRRIIEIVHGTRAISADPSLRLARYFGTSDRFWLNLQTRYDLERERDRLGDRLEVEVVRRVV